MKFFNFLKLISIPRLHTRVYVVMCNDFPNSAWTTRDAAENHCDKMRAIDKADNLRDASWRIPSYKYWRVYELKLNCNGG